MIVRTLGAKFNKLTVVCTELYGRNVKVQCECGTIKYVRTDNLRKGTTKSCGCHRITRVYKHGGKGSPEYISWLRTLERCYSDVHPNFKYYGGRGIEVYSFWRNDFTEFLAYMGEMPKDGVRYTLDRIDNELGYFPHNVRWATDAEQGKNKRPRKPRSSKK